jgi:cell pole-organizing protein PopZ
MAEPAKAEQDQSMEEILQSIKRIIAEEGETAPPRPAPASPAPAAATAAPVASMEPTPAPAPMGSDILELTDMISEEAAAMNAITPPASIDPLDTILSVAPDTVEPTIIAPTPTAPEPTPAPKAEAAPQPQPQPVAPAPLSASATSQAPGPEESLLSDVAAMSSAQSLRSLVPPAVTHIPPASPAPGFRNGDTVEDLVLEALRPMLKEWLETNLPGIVERKVQREIERISRLNAS